MTRIPEETLSFFATWALVAATVVTAAWIVARFVPMPARCRIAILVIAAAISLSPLTRSLWPARPASNPPPSASVVGTEIAQLATPEPMARASTPPSTKAIARPSPTTFDASMLLWLWWGGAVLAGFRLGVSILRMNRMRDEAVIGPDGLRRSGRLASPVAAGFPRATILVPATWPEPFPTEEAEACLLHEGAHVQGRHVAIRVIGEAVVAWFWWLPPAWLALRTLEESLEELADQRVADRRVALAHALVRSTSLRANSPRLCAGIGTPARHLEHRIRVLLENRPMRLHHKLIATAALGGFVLAAGTFAATSLIVSQAAENYGLVPGSTWTYERIGEGGEKSTMTTVAVRTIPFGERQVVELLTKADRYSTYSYASVDAKGYWGYANSRMQGPGFERSLPPEPSWRLPLAAGATWSYWQPFRGQVMVREGEEPNYEDLGFHCSAKVVSTSETVEVPAGRFETVHVRIDRVSKANGKNSTDLWIAPKVGVVRAVDRYGQGESERRLVSFTPGKPLPITIPAGFVTVTQDHVVDYLRAPFAVGPLEGGRRKILRLGAHNVPFDAMDVGTVSEAALEDREGYSEFGRLGLIGDRLTALAMLAALQNGADPKTLKFETSNQTARGNGKTDVVVVLQDHLRKYSVRYAYTDAGVTSVTIEL